VLVRPEQIVLDAGCPRDLVEDPSSRGRVTEISFYGHDSIARLQLSGGEQVIARVRGSDLPPAGSDVTFRVTGTARVFTGE
jgi:hypothetical protein